MHFENIYPYFIVLIFIFISIFPMIKNGENTRHRKWIWDDLDSPHAIKKLLGTRDNKWFTPEYSFIPSLMNGSDLCYFINEPKLYNILYMCFKPFNAYILEIVIIRLIAFTGMFLFSSSYIFTPEQTLLSLGVSLGFCLLPYYMPFFATISAHPLVIYAFLNISTNLGNVSDWLILALYPLFSMLIVGGYQIILVMCFLWFIGVYLGTFDILNAFYAIFLISASFLITEYRLFLKYFFDKTIYHRSENDPLKLKNFVQDFRESFNRSFQTFFRGTEHYLSLAKPFISISLLIASVGIFYTGHNKILYFSLLSLLIFIAFFSTFFDINRNMIVLTNKIPFLKMFNIRLESLMPFLTFVLFAISINVISGIKYGSIIAFFLVSIQIVYCLWYELENFNIEGIPSYKEFYAVDIFKKIKEYINKPLDSYRVISVGMHPMVALYNDFYTLDGYISMYPLEYKHQFRKIIAGELDKDEKLKNYFDSWGSRCYAFYARMNLGKLSLNKNDNLNKELDYNIEAFKALGGKYILSALTITNAEKIGLKFLEAFEDKDSYYKVSLYEAI